MCGTSRSWGSFSACTLIETSYQWIPIAIHHSSLINSMMVGHHAPQVLHTISSITPEYRLACLRIRGLLDFSFTTDLQMHHSGCGNSLGFFAMLLRKHVVYIKVLYTCRGLCWFTKGFTQPIRCHKHSILREGRPSLCCCHQHRPPLLGSPTSSACIHNHTQMDCPYVIALSRAPMLYINIVTIRYSIRLFLI